MPEGERSLSEEYLFWRDEILQVMYWMAGEGLGDTVGPPILKTFLGGDEAALDVVLGQMVSEGFVEQAGVNLFALTPLGTDAGKRCFALEFEGLLGQAHGECGPDCWCHTSAARAAQCATERLAKVYGG